MPRSSAKRDSFRILLFVAAALGLAGCAGSGVSALPSPTAVNQDSIRTAWRQSLHSQTYGVGKGSNTYCARCHSPTNWDPASKVDPAPNCVSCKFDFDPAPRRAEHNVLVSASDWHNIGCEVCHRTSGGIAEPTITWWNQASGEYEPVATATALCGKCHADSDVLRHKRDLGTAAHATMQCTTCHDPHSTAAGCTSAACHAQVMSPVSKIPGHDQAHSRVACTACHDASGMAVKPNANGQWVTWRTTELLGRATTSEYKSHAMTKTVNCQRCHYPNNPWGLSNE